MVEMNTWRIDWKEMKNLFLIILILVSGSSIAQTQPQKTLTDIVNERGSFNTSQKEKAIAYAKEHDVPLVFRDSKGNYVHLVGVDDFGIPIYKTTLNAGAAITTGVNQLRAGGSLGLNLEGEGMLIGVWDNDVVKNHVEFGNRRISNQGTSVSDHSTHVTGTLIASGIQANAKGMAPKASATTWDFENDEAEMAALARPDQTSLLVSNHSYGVVLGFFLDDNNDWQWAGNSGISPNEDYRFGFYSTQSRTIDNIAFNAPYYTIVWAAGNDRSDVGDGSHPSDGNGGYDLIGPEGVSKNIITVGAVQKVTNYTGPSSVVMSNFSSWGPTDEGRIKPDLVGAGVSIYSTSVTTGGADSYATQNGTSMSAPNVSGSLLLLQELHRDLNAGNFMRAATVKALAIHTAKEAGLNPGPDYSFGWGLLDVEAAANILINKDQQSIVVLENTLLNGGVFDFNFEPQQNTKVTATIVWTDPPGTPPSASVDPTNKMLVNDLDLRIFDSGDNTVFPWRLNRTTPSAAATPGDNDVDNVEKIEFSNPEPRLYTLRVSHKGQLANSLQNYSLILTFTPINDPKTAYYWIGNSGNWNDPTKWSLTSGGAPVNQVPDINSRVIVDENSFSAAGQAISLTADATCGSLTWLAKSNSSLSLNNHKLNIDGNFIISVNSFSASTNGQIELMGTSTSQNQLNLNGTDLSKVEFIINSPNNSVWTVNGALNVGGIILQQGGLVAKGVTVKTNRLNADSPNAKVLDISNSTFNDVTQSILNSSNLDLTSTSSTNINLASGVPATVTWSGIDYDGTLNTQTSQATLSGGASVGKIVVGNTLTLNGNNTFGEFNAGGGATLNIQTGTTQSLSQLTTLNASSANRISLGTVGGGTSTLNFDGHFKLCFDYLDVNSVAVNGDVKISAGSNSTLTNAANWSPGSCAEALFADFDFQFSCEGSLTEFTDLSDGNIVSWEWNFGDSGSGENTSDEQDPYHIFNSTGTYTVTVTVSDADETETYSRDVVVVDNNLPTNKVIIANAKLFSELTAESYQWFKNGDVLQNEVSRSYEFNGDPGAYFVVIKNSTCNIPSSTFVVTGEEETNFTQLGEIYPNPASDKIYINLPPENLPAKVTLINAIGQTVLTTQVTEPHSLIYTDNLRSGLYIIDISSRRSVRRKIVIEK
jgi:hypothetical protein